jgi:uncharacterized membrane protein
MLKTLGEFVRSVEDGNHEGWKLSALVMILVFCAAVVAYAPSIKTGFVWDAEFIYLHYEDVQEIGNLRDVFVTPIALEVSGNGETISGLNYYRPLTKAFYTIGYFFFGENPIGYKVVSVLLHGVVALLVYGLVSSITSKPLLSCLASLVFAVNPIHTEAVVWTYSVILSGNAVVVWKRPDCRLPRYVFSCTLKSRDGRIGVAFTTHSTMVA